jgi:hypothetical protein
MRGVTAQRNTEQSDAILEQDQQDGEQNRQRKQRHRTVL